MSGNRINISVVEDSLVIQFAFDSEAMHLLAGWIDTDDLNGEKQELHYIKPEGYEKLGERYVEAAVMLVQAK